MLMFQNPRIAIAGATGAVGQELLKLIDERQFPYSNLELIASGRSAGTVVEFQNKAYTVRDLAKFSFKDTDIAFFSCGTSVSREWAQKAADEGCLVIDNTNAFRMAPASPLAVPQVNPHTLFERPTNGVIANPNCSTIEMVRALAPIRDRFGLKKVVASTYQAASGGGLTGIDELKDDAIAALAGTAAPKATRFPVGLSFNVIPQIDVMMDDGFTLEELKMQQETRKILEMPDLDVTATCVRVPVVNGHSVAVYVETERDVGAEDLIACLKGGEELQVYAGQSYPTPRFMDSPNVVHVGRIRKVPGNPRALWLWVVADNLRIGAALNALQIAERLVPRNSTTH